MLRRHHGPVAADNALPAASVQTHSAGRQRGHPLCAALCKSACEQPPPVLPTLCCPVPCHMTLRLGLVVIVFLCTGHESGLPIVNAAILWLSRICSTSTCLQGTTWCNGPRNSAECHPASESMGLCAPQSWSQKMKMGMNKRASSGESMEPAHESATSPRSEHRSHGISSKALHHGATAYPSEMQLQQVCTTEYSPLLQHLALG